MNQQELLEIISVGETSKVQFKRELSEQNKIAAEIAAMANAKGGIIIFGVEDKIGAIFGLSYEQLQFVNNRIAAIANDLVKPAVYITTEVVSINSKKNILIAYIEEGINKPYKDNNGIIWVKQGADKRKLTDNAEIMRLFQHSGNLFADEMEVYDTSIADIDERLFAQYFQKEFKQTYQEKDLTYEEALKVKRVVKNGKATLAGLLFFGRDPQNIKPAFTIKAVSFVGNDIANTQYRNKPEDFKGTIPEIFKQATSFLNSNLRHIQKGQDFNSIGILEISDIALQELLANALIHRDYFKNAPIRVLIFDNRVEIISPGHLPNSLTIEEAKYGNTVIRNNQIISFSVHSLPYSGLGSGLKRAFKEQPNIELINDVDGEQFIVKIPRPNTEK